MNPVRSPLLLVLLGLLTALAVAAPAAAESCADRLIADWADNAQIDGTYPIPCYRAAIQALPEDLRSYSSAADDIRRAQQEALAERSQGGGGGDGSGDAEGAGAETGAETTTGGERDPQASTQQDTLAGVPSEDSAGGNDGGSATPPDDATVAAPSAQLLDQELDDGGSSLPVPIIVLLVAAGLAAVALACFLIVRQLHGRRASSD
jgi:hypothetical protein